PRGQRICHGWSCFKDLASGFSSPNYHSSHSLSLPAWRIKGKELNLISLSVRPFEVAGFLAKEIGF
ncbi:MAG: hypothetical protein ACO21I_03850, partial [Candidatus Nanopelagicaceae bacterium]